MDLKPGVTIIIVTLDGYGGYGQNYDAGYGAPAPRGGRGKGMLLMCHLHC